MTIKETLLEHRRTTNVTLVNETFELIKIFIVKEMINIFVESDVAVTQDIWGLLTYDIQEHEYYCNKLYNSIKEKLLEEGIILYTSVDDRSNEIYFRITENDK